ncbi:hypothetical protein KEM52_003623, partial [Ascosphaera acerosa]
GAPFFSGWADGGAAFGGGGAGVSEYSLMARKMSTSGLSLHSVSSMMTANEMRPQTPSAADGDAGSIAGDAGSVSPEKQRLLKALEHRRRMQQQQQQREEEQQAQRQERGDKHGGDGEMAALRRGSKDSSSAAPALTLDRLGGVAA